MIAHIHTQIYEIIKASKKKNVILFILKTETIESEDHRIMDIYRRMMIIKEYTKTII